MMINDYTLKQRDRNPFLYHRTVIANSHMHRRHGMYRSYITRGVGDIWNSLTSLLIILARPAIYLLRMVVTRRCCAPCIVPLNNQSRELASVGALART